MSKKKGKRGPVEEVPVLPDDASVESSSDLADAPVESRTDADGASVEPAATPSPQADPAPGVAAHPTTTANPITPADPTTPADADLAERRGRKGWIATGIIVALVAGYLALAAVAAGRVPSGVTVLGTPLGGMNQEAATAALKDPAHQAEQEPVTITAAGESATLIPAESGLSVDVEATVDSLVDLSLNPLDIIRVFGGAPTAPAPMTTVNEEELLAAVSAASASLDVEPVDALVTLGATSVQVTPGEDGLAVDTQATATALATAWPVATLPAVTAPAAPAVTTAAAEVFAANLEDRILSAPVTLTGENGEAVVTPSQMIAHGTVEATDGQLGLIIDGEALAAELERANPALATEPAGASFSFTKKRTLKVVDSTPGRGIDGELLGPAVLTAAQSESKAGALPYHDTEAAVTSANSGIADLNVLVASFDTPLTDEPLRTKNLVRGAQKVAGTLLKPGEQFSLIEALSPITVEGGYYPAHVIVDGFLSDGIGGGLSQMSTTVYNAAYFAGLQIDEHRPHSKYFARYPAGREATLYIGAIDMKFTNNTPYALAINAYIEGGRVHVDIWSTPHFEVTTSASKRSNVTPATTVESDREGCIATAPGEPGFTISNTRTVSLAGEVVDSSKETWTYQPNNGVRCVKP